MAFWFSDPHHEGPRPHPEEAQQTLTLQWRRAPSARRAPSPLFFAIAATLHAAPLPALALAGVEVVDVAIRSFTFSNSLALLVDEQTFDRERTDMQRDFGRQ